jgi:hypothetical protein
MSDYEFKEELLVFEITPAWIIHEPRTPRIFLARVAFPLRAVGTMKDKAVTDGAVVRHAIGVNKVG